MAEVSDDDVRREVERLNDLLERLEAMSGPEADVAMAAIESLTGVYGAALERVVGACDRATVRQLANDELVGHLLVLHGLHPDPPNVRIARALDDVAGELPGAAQLTGVEDGIAHVEVTAKGCGSSAGDLARSVEAIVLEAAPELAGVQPTAVTPPREPALIPVDTLLRRSSS